MRKTPPPGNASKRSKATAPVAPNGTSLRIRPVCRDDLNAVIEMDAMVTGLAKRDYWNSLYKRYADAVATGQHFLVATAGSEVIGFVIGEVRDWEFGSPPCGWVFAIDVRPDARLLGAGTQLLQAICKCFKRAGVSKVRTLLSRENTLILSFFRSQGMMIGPFIRLELDIEP